MPVFCKLNVAIVKRSRKVYNSLTEGWVESIKSWHFFLPDFSDLVPWERDCKGDRVDLEA